MEDRQKINSASASRTVSAPANLKVQSKRVSNRRTRPVCSRVPPAAGRAPRAATPPGPLDLAALKDCAARTSRALDVLSRILARDLADPSPRDDPRLRPAARHLAQVNWLTGLPDRLDPAAPAAARALPAAREATDHIRLWLADLAAAEDALVVEVTEDRQSDIWADPLDRLRAFACETAEDMIAELRDELDLLDRRGVVPKG